VKSILATFLFYLILFVELDNLNDAYFSSGLGCYLQKFGLQRGEAGYRGHVAFAKAAN